MLGSKIPSSGEFSDEGAGELLVRHKNVLLGGVLAIALVIGGSWYINRSNILKEERASQAYTTAMQAAASGNIPLAQTDLQKMVTRYRGTNAGTSGSMTLAKLYFEEGKFQEGIDALGTAKADASSRFDIAMLRASGLEGLEKFEEAAGEYLNAVGQARFDADKDLARAAAARAYAAAGNKERAIAIWQEIADNPKSRSLLEAQIRLGELQAAVAE